MKRFLPVFILFALLLAPSFATGSEPQGLANLTAADTALDEAKTAAAAAPEDEALKTALADAQTAYDDSLAAAKVERAQLDSSSEEHKALSMAIIEADPTALADEFDPAAAIGLMEKWIIQGKDFLVDNGPGYAVKAVLFLVIILIFKFLAAIAAGLALKALSSNKLKISELLKKFFVGIIKKVVFFAGILIALGSIGVDTGPILAGAGVIGFVVGFALQDTLSNFAAGIMILMYRPFDVGDVITAAGETGKVSDLTLVSTTLHTPDNQKLIVPNSSIWGGTIRNITAQDTRRVDFTIGVGYDDDLDKVQALLLEVASAHKLVLKDQPVQVEVLNLGDSCVDFIVRPWAKTGDYWTVYFDLTKEFKKRLDAAGFSIPYPQTDLHVISMPEGK